MEAANVRRANRYLHAKSDQRRTMRGQPYKPTATYAEQCERLRSEISQLIFDLRDKHGLTAQQIGGISLTVLQTSYADLFNIKREPLERYRDALADRKRREESQCK